MSNLGALYDCDRCPAYCCSYPSILCTEKDLARIAEYLGVELDEAKKEFTRLNTRGEVVFRHKPDEIFGSICVFLDSKTRNCTIYAVKPEVAETFPGVGSCGYYDFLTFERRAQRNPNFISTTWLPFQERLQ